MKKLELIDNFGSEIKWKMLQKDKFKSPFGGVVTLLIFILFFVKIYYFINKVQQFGFAKNKALYIRLDENKNITEYINLTNFSLFCQFDALTNTIQTYNQKNKIRKEYSLNDYLKYKLFWGIENFKTNITLLMEKIPQTDVFGDLTYYHNFRFKSKNINETEILIPLKLPSENKAQKSDYHTLFRIEFEFTDELVKILSTTIDIDQINYGCYYDYFRLDQKDYTLKRLTNNFYKRVAYNYTHFQPIHIRKIEVEKKIDLDIKEILYDTEDNIEIDPMQMYSFEVKGGEKIIDNTQGKGIEKVVYSHQFQFFFDVHKNYNEVTILSIDDFLSVMGGFLELIMMLAEFFVGTYNEHLTNKILNSFCYEKIDQYDERMNKLKIIIKKSSNKNENNLKGSQKFGITNQNIINNEINDLIKDSINDSNHKTIPNFLKKINTLANRDKINNKDISNNNNSIFKGTKELENQISNQKITKQTKKDQIVKEEAKLIFDKSKGKNVLVVRGERISKNPSPNEYTNIEKQSNNEINPLNKYSDKNIVKQAKEEITNKANYSNIELKSFEENNKRRERRSYENSIYDKQIDKEKNDKGKFEKHFLKNKFKQSFLSKVLHIYDKKRKKFNNFDYFDYISVDIYLNLLSGFEAFKFFLFDKKNKQYFDSLSDSYLYSNNCDILNKETVGNKNLSYDEETIKNKNDFQIYITKRFEMLID